MTTSIKFEVYSGTVHPSVSCHSLDQLEQVLDQLNDLYDGHTPPLAVSIEVRGNIIEFGLGTDPTFLCVQISPCDGEFYLPVGSEPTSEALMFYGSGQDSYWKPRNLIPLALARQAVRHYAEQQDLFPGISWEDWNGNPVEQA